MVVTRYQNECDHIVGIYEFRPQQRDHIFQNEAIEPSLKLTGLGWIMKYHYCPFCGAKIDWDKIKEELDGR